jgi:hypothetical protein
VDRGKTPRFGVLAGDSAQATRLASDSLDNGVTLELPVLAIAPLQLSEQRAHAISPTPVAGIIWHK